MNGLVWRFMVPSWVSGHMHRRGIAFRLLATAELSCRAKTWAPHRRSGLKAVQPLKPHTGIPATYQPITLLTQGA
jgi:hypothetical protein